MDLILNGGRDSTTAKLEKEFTIVPHPIKAQRKKWAAMAITLILAGGGTLAFHYGIQNQNSSFEIKEVRVISYNNSGYIDSLNISMEFVSMVHTSTHVYFRIIQPGTVINGNMFLWFPANNQTLQSGYPAWIIAVPEYPQFALNSSLGFRIVAYYGSAQGSYYYS